MIKRILLAGLLVAMATSAQAESEAEEFMRERAVNIQTQIRSRCEAKWKLNYIKMSLCVDRHTEGSDVVDQMIVMLVEKPKVLLALGACIAEWTDAYGYDYPKIIECMGMQVEAMQKLGIE